MLKCTGLFDAQPGLPWSDANQNLTSWALAEPGIGLPPEGTDSNEKRGNSHRQSKAGLTEGLRPNPKPLLPSTSRKACSPQLLLLSASHLVSNNTHTHTQLQGRPWSKQHLEADLRKIFQDQSGLGVMGHPFNVKARDLCMFKSSLVYILSSGSARAVHEDPVSKQRSWEK